MSNSLAIPGLAFIHIGSFAGSAVSFPSVRNAPASSGVVSGPDVCTPWNSFCFSVPVAFFFLSFLSLNLFKIPFDLSLPFSPLTFPHYVPLAPSPRI